MTEKFDKLYEEIIKTLEEAVETAGKTKPEATGVAGSDADAEAEGVDAVPVSKEVEDAKAPEQKETQDLADNEKKAEAGVEDAEAVSADAAKDVKSGKSA